MIPEYIRRILNLFNEAGFECYVVGGAVRDILAGIKPHDYDITTSALPSQTAELMEKSGYRKIIDSSAKYGTVVFIDPADSSRRTEITTMRCDGDYEDNRHPDSVVFTRSVEQDAARRDFTVNSLYMDVAGSITDPNGGAADIKNKIIRAVGDPVRRFEEDALRILRAVRFQAQTGFAVEEGTSRAMKECAPLLRNISAERIFNELTAVVTSANAPCAIRDNLEVISVIIPELMLQKDFDQRSRYHDRDLLTHTLDVLSAVPPGQTGKRDAALAYAAILHDIGKPQVFTVDENGTGHMKKHALAGNIIALRLADELRFPGSLRDEVSMLVTYHDSFPPPDRRSVRRFISIFEPDILDKLFILQRADISAHSEAGRERMKLLDSIIGIRDELTEEDACLRLRDLAVNGDDLKRMGIPEGPQIGRMLNILFEKVMDETLKNDRDELLRYAREHQEIIN